MIVEMMLNEEEVQIIENFRTKKEKENESQRRDYQVQLTVLRKISLTPNEVRSILDMNEKEEITEKDWKQAVQEEIDYDFGEVYNDIEIERVK